LRGCGEGAVWGESRHLWSRGIVERAVFGEDEEEKPNR
jgi:hypothetical protein